MKMIAQFSVLFFLFMRYESYVFLKRIFIQMEIKGWCI